LVWGEFGEEVGVPGFEGGEEEAAKTVGKGAEVDEEVVGLFRMNEGLGFGVAGDGGDDAVNVGVVLGLSPPGMKDGGDGEF